MNPLQDRLRRDVQHQRYAQDHASSLAPDKRERFAYVPFPLRYILCLDPVGRRHHKYGSDTSDRPFPLWDTFGVIGAISYNVDAAAFRTMMNRCGYDHPRFASISSALNPCEMKDAHYP